MHRKFAGGREDFINAEPPFYFAENR